MWRPPVVIRPLTTGRAVGETICGGSGAGPSWHGTSGVHVHMTNTVRILVRDEYEDIS